MSELRDRAHGGEVEKATDATTLRTQIRQMQAQFQLAMPRGLEATQLVRDALTALRETPGLADCDPKTVLGGLMTCAQLGLRVGVLGQAWLLPFYDAKSRGKKATLVIGYQGLAELGYRSDKVAGIAARTVFENDPVFEVEFGTADEIHHKPLMEPRRGRPVAYYCVVHIKGGRPIFYVMSHPDMEDYRDQHATARTRDGKIVGPWLNNFEGMAHKTCLRQLSKWMPKSTDLARALAADEGVRVDITPSLGPEEATHHYAEGEYIEGQVVENGEQTQQEPPA